MIGLSASERFSSQFDTLSHLLQGGRGWWKSGASADVVPLQLAVKSSSADPKHPSGHGFVPFDLFKDPLNSGTLNVLKIGCGGSGQA